MKAIQIEKTGTAQELQLKEIPKPQPNPHEVLIEVHYAGINFIDIYYRTGVYPQPQLPVTLGQEGMGVIVETGAAVEDFNVGDRVTFAMGGSGSYAQFATAATHNLIKVPDDIQAKTATAMGIQGLTAHYLTHDVFQLKRGHTALVHAAAGGTGHILVQIAKLVGTTVIATVSNQVKADIARACGADHAIIYKDYQFLSTVKTLLPGSGVDVVYDSVGQATFDQSLAALKPRGMLVMYGQSSGKVPPFDILKLSTGGSLFLTRPILTHYMGSREEIDRRSHAVFAFIRAEAIKINIHKVFPLTEVVQAHECLENRQAHGKVLLKIK